MPMTDEITTQHNYSSLQPSWKMVFLLSRIDRFDELWPSVINKEHAIVSKWIITEPENVDDLYKQLDGCLDFLTNFKELTFWYETDTEIHPLIRCLVFVWHLRLIPHFWDCGEGLDISVVVQMLIKSDYTWVSYIPLNNLLKSGYDHHMEINHWILSVLSALIDGQQNIMRKIDLYSSAWKLIASNELLLYIIKDNQGIRTTAIAKKLGTSIATVKRMLNRLIENRKIERNGVGRGTHYILV